MDPAALVGLCTLLAHGTEWPALPKDLQCGAAASARVARTQTARPVELFSDVARDGIARVAYAEAGNQGDSGLAAVVYTILNRLEDGRWGASVDSVLNAPHQFEPVMRVGGDWRRLKPVSEAQRARIETILNLALDGRLPDLTNGARYFQNPRIVADRAANGQVSAALVGFSGAPPSAVIGAHSFYAEAGRGAGRRRGSQPATVTGRVSRPSAVDAIFVGANRAAETSFDQTIASVEAAKITSENIGSAATDPGESTDPVRALFVRSDGRRSGFAR